MPNGKNGTEPKWGKITSWAQLPSTGIILIFGHKGEGKTGLAYYLAELATASRRKVATVGLPEAAQKLFPKRGFTHLATVEDVAALENHLVVVDEAIFSAHARRSQSAGNVQWARLSAITRHKRHLLLFVSQHNRQLDVELLSSADLVIFKKPSGLHIRLTRAELREEIVEARQGFLKRRQPQRWCFLIDYHGERKGWLSNPLPGFWKDKLSRAFAAAEV